MTHSIAIIEDDPAVADLMAATLTDHGYRTHHYASAISFEAGLNDTKPSLCLVDLGFPDQNGLDLVKSLANKHTIPCNKIQIY